MATETALSLADQKNLLIVFQCLEAPLKVNLAKVADLGGYANKASANVMWCKLKKKLGVSNVGVDDKAVMLTPAKTPRGKAKAPPSGKREISKAECEDEDGDGDGDKDGAADDRQPVGKVKNESEEETYLTAVEPFGSRRAGPSDAATEHKGSSEGKITAAVRPRRVRVEIPRAARGRKRGREEEVSDREDASDNEADASIGYYVEDGAGGQSGCETPTRGRKRARDASVAAAAAA